MTPYHIDCRHFQLSPITPIAAIFAISCRHDADSLMLIFSFAISYFIYAIVFLFLFIFFHFSPIFAFISRHAAAAAIDTPLFRAIWRCAVAALFSAPALPQRRGALIARAAMYSAPFD
jgi:hypothetical protein